MILTRIWSAILVLLATVFLAGMFILTHNAEGEFSDADRASIRGITDGGLVAFEADIASSPVSQAPQIMTDSRMKDALDPDPDAPPRPLHLGMRTGLHALRQHLERLQAVGVHHVALNLRFNRSDIPTTLETLAEGLLPHLSAQEP